MITEVLECSVQRPLVRDCKQLTFNMTSLKTEKNDVSRRYVVNILYEITMHVIFVDLNPV